MYEVLLDVAVLAESEEEAKEAVRKMMADVGQALHLVAFPLEEMYESH